MGRLQAADGRVVFGGSEAAGDAGLLGGRWDGVRGWLVEEDSKTEGGFAEGSFAEGEQTEEEKGLASGEGRVEGGHAGGFQVRIS